MAGSRRPVWLAALAAVVWGAVTPDTAGAQLATGGGSFTRLGPSARAIGLGRAYVALAEEDAMGLFWSSAAVASGEGVRAAATNRLFGPGDLGMDGALSFAAGAVTGPIGWGLRGGAGAMFLGVSGIEQYSSQAVFEGEFSDSEMLAAVSLARTEGPVSAGLSVRYISQGFSGLAHYGDTKQAGIGLETSLSTRFWRRVRLGASLCSEVDLGNDRVPMRGLIGLAYDPRVWVAGRRARAIAALDVEQVKDRPMRLHVGIGLEGFEAYPGVDAALRIGRSNRMLEPRVTNDLVEGFDPMNGEDYVAASAQWTMGLGVRRGAMSVDYALAFGMLHDTQYITLSYGY